MKNRVLQTVGDGKFVETVYELPDLATTDIRVKAVMTGVCRSDIDMMQGNFGPLPLSMQGHEGLGIVVDVGTDVDNIEIGDYVATRGEPAYADYYNVRKDEYVKVPEADPKYILEPVACALNIAFRMKTGSTLIIGSGFLSHVIAQYAATAPFNFAVDDVVGSSNVDLWNEIGIGLTTIMPEKKYDTVIVLNGTIDFDQAIDLCNDNAKLLLGCPLRDSTTNFERALWKNITIECPSPRDPDFIDCMWEAGNRIEKGSIVVDKFWTAGYNRETEWQEAFEEGLNRPQFYSRGYIYWL